MKLRMLLSLLLLVITTSWAVGQEPAKKTSADLKWAQGVANDFLSAVASGQMELAESLVSDSFLAAMAKSHKSGLREWLSSNAAIKTLNLREIKSSEISPDGNEVLIAGLSQATDRNLEFTVRLVKSRSNGEWEVRYFNLAEMPLKNSVTAKVPYIAPVPSVTARPRLTPTVPPKPHELVLGKLPDDFIVCAVTVRNAPKLADVQISEGQTTGIVDIVVNQPKKNVVLLVSSYNPTIWNVARTADTRIVGVVATGYHKQAFLGLERGVKKAVSTYDDEAQFKPFRGSGSESSATQQSQAFDLYAQQILGKQIAATGLRLADGPYYIGEEPDEDVELVQDKRKTIDDLAIEGSLPPGEKGLEVLVKEGKIRPASADDIEAWREIALQRQTDPDRRPGPYLRADRAYVMLKETPLPPGLSGAHAVSFLVPKGFAIHKPSRQHCSFFMMDGTELGPGAP